MQIFLAGAHGGVGQILGKLLVEGGHKVQGLIRQQSQQSDLEIVGVEAVLGDLNDNNLEKYLKEAEVVIFAAAGSPGQEQSVDHLGVARLVQAAQARGVRRYLLLSALGAHAPSSWGKTYQNYLQAKADGEQAVKISGLDWTIIRPGSLTDEPGKGSVEISTQPGGYGSIAREDVANVLAKVVDASNTIGTTFEVYGGSTPIDHAIDAL